MILQDYSIRTRLLATTVGALALMLLIAAIALFSLDQVTTQITAAIGGDLAQSKVFAGVLVQIEDVNRQTRQVLFALIGLASIVMIPAGLWVSGLICRPLREAVVIAEAVARGQLDNQITRIGRDETAALMTALARMQDDLLGRQQRDQAAAQELARINLALDCVSTPLTISDKENVLIYMNQAAIVLWQSMESVMAQRVPGFSVASMKQHSLADFFDDQEVAALYRAELEAPRLLEIPMCGRSLRVSVTPVRDSHGNYLGRVSQWLDRTAEVAIEHEVASIVHAASAGDFARRIAADSLDGFFRQISLGINTLLDTTGRSIADVGAVLTGLARGDLTHKIDADYQGMPGQLKDDANATVDHLRDIIISIKQASEAINTAAQEIASGNQDLSSRTEAQASSLEETAASMERLTDTVRKNAAHASQASALAASAQKTALSGGEVVGRVVNTMGGIHQASSRIAEIIGVIDGIAFQTNILALNAAVEAARAGEQGRGFAVVASEVRSLAQRSASAAKEIKSLITDSVAQVEMGSRLVEEAGRTMGQIVAGVQQVAGLIADISVAGAEQTTGIEQVGIAISQMDETTQQNAALVEEAAAAAENLEEQARTLVSSIRMFKLPESDSNHLEAAEQEAVFAEHMATVTRGRAALPHSLDDEWAEF